MNPKLRKFAAELADLMEKYDAMLQTRDATLHILVDGNEWDDLSFSDSIAAADIRAALEESK